MFFFYVSFSYALTSFFVFFASVFYVSSFFVFAFFVVVVSSFSFEVFVFYCIFYDICVVLLSSSILVHSVTSLALLLFAEAWFSFYNRPSIFHDISWVFSSANQLLSLSVCSLADSVLFALFSRALLVF